ncbi:MAG: transglutaminase domain-containing protein [Chloroflexi bacterium]|nr:transglutaminase domain-containing protein [Chloroflexota bacterium]
MTTAASVRTTGDLLARGRLSFHPLRQFTPSEGWLTLVAVLAPLFVIAWTISEAAWAETPSLQYVLLVGALIGLGVAKAPGWQTAWHAGAVLVGAAFVYWQLSTLTEAAGWVEPFRVLNMRLAEWGETATEGGISTDTMPFALFLTAMAWVIAYVSTWAAFRRRSVWLSVVPGGLAMFSNLSYLPEQFGFQMFIYLAFAMLLIVRMNSLNQWTAWSGDGLSILPSYGLRALFRGSWYILAVLLIAFILPSRPWQSPWLDTAWEWTRAPLDTIEEDLDRLFAALPDRKGGLNLNFGTHLPFQGSISLSDEPLFLFESPQPAYLRARAYPVYTAQGWTTGQMQTVTFDDDLPWSRPRGYQQRQELEHSVVPLFSTDTMPVSNLPLLHEGDAAVKVQALPAPTFWLPLAGHLNADPGLPADIELIVPVLQAARLYERDVTTQADVILAMVPEDSVVTQVAFRDTPEGGNERAYRVAEPEAGEAATEREALEATLRRDIRSLTWVQVSRRPPDPPDIVALRSAGKLDPGDTYSITSSLSTASPDQLRAAGNDYPGWVSDRYLQLPADQPKRVSDLAREITLGITNPYDKAKAIENFLHTLGYDQEIPAPPYDVDGVEHFIFELERGYSEYFGSAMAVLLREVEVPARMVVGYTPREYDPNAGHWIVREADSHGWAEAYFPGYGWVEFEPTPNWQLPAAPESFLFEGANVTATGAEDFFDEDEFFEEDAFLTVGDLDVEEDPFISGTVMAWSLAVLFVVWATWYGYRRTFVKVSVPTTVFERMCWLGAWAGLPHHRNQTPAEYTSRLARVFPGASGDLRILGNAHAVERYSRRSLSQLQSEQVGRAWTHVRKLLFRRAVLHIPFT